MSHQKNSSSAIARRWFLQQCGVGVGAIALNQMLLESGWAAPAQPGMAQDPLVPRQPHHTPKAKNIIFMFMGGGPSHLELYDHKPVLGKFDGKLPPEELLKGYRAAFINPKSKFLGPRFKFAKQGESGAELSEVLPHLAEVVDEIAIIKSMKTDAFNHAPAQIQALTGSQLFGKPSLGAWTIYGLGSESKNLPGFVVFSSGNKGPSGGSSCWGSGFLPSVHQGVMFRGGQEPVLYLKNPPGISGQLQRDSLDTLKALNQNRLNLVGDPEIATRINSFEMAYRMQSSAPDVMDITQETRQTLEMYGAEPGKTSFANNCLLARRLVERGVRCVQLFHESWDQHGGLVNGIKSNCKATDQGAAALIKDLKQRGLLNDTLVVWGGEFGRTPMVQGGNDGRDHHPNAFTMWLAGGGIKGGVTIGKSDDFGFNVIEDEVPVYDLHATILHLLGLNPEQLSYRFQGLDQRLIGVNQAKVVQKILA